MTISTVGAPDSGNEQQTSIFGYGEINYTRPRNNSADSQVDVRRAVIGFGHRFDESTRFAMELEFEHAVSSASDRGEVEVEQVYIDHAFKPGLGVQAGLFLMPAGLINRRHEPTAYYGVERNFVAILERNGIKRTDPTGQPFDANLHQAMAEQPSAEHAPGTVMQAWTQAWTLNGRLLKPAMVVVARRGEQDEASAA